MTGKGRLGGTSRCAGLSQLMSINGPGRARFYAEALVKLEATKQEIEEAPAVAVYMGGGPSLMYAAGAVQAFDEFSEEATAQ